jgi:molecular chaperone GrpE (heat shock protein)
MDSEKAMKAVADLILAAQKIKAVNDEQRAYTRKLQELAAEARRTGERINAARMPVHAYNYEDGVYSLLDALERYEKATGQTKGSR